MDSMTAKKTGKGSGLLAWVAALGLGLAGVQTVLAETVSQEVVFSAYEVSGQRGYEPAGADPVSLDELLETMSRSGFDSGRLQIIYRAIGSHLGAVHKIQGVDPAGSWDKLKRDLRGTSVRRDNLVVLPGDDVLMLDPAPVVFPEVSADVLQMQLVDFSGLLLVEDLFLVDSPVAASWMAVLPDVTAALLEGYCKPLTDGDDNKTLACVSRLADMVAQDVTIVDRITSAGAPGQAPEALSSRLVEQPTAVGGRELLDRLNGVFGPLVDLAPFPPG